MRGEVEPERGERGRTEAHAAGGQEELTIDVAYQACNDSQCLPQKTLQIKVPVRVARRGETVKQVNDKLFAPPAKK